MTSTIPRTSETCAQTAKRVRKALKERYPGVKFSVRSQTYAGGASIHARYVDGPGERDVWTFLQRFAGADFDGMTDSMSYRDDVLLSNADGSFELIDSGADFVFADRRISQAWRDEIAAEITRVTGQPCDLTSWGDDDGSGQPVKRNGAGWDARYDAYVIEDDCSACIYGRAADGTDCTRCDGRGTIAGTARIGAAGDKPQTYGRDLFHQRANVARES